MGWSQSHICTVLLTIQRYTTFHEILTFVNCFLTVQVGLLSASPQQSTYIYRAAFDLLLLIYSLSPSVCSLTSSCILSLHLSIFSHHLSVFFSSGSLTSSVCCLLYQMVLSPHLSVLFCYCLSPHLSVFFSIRWFSHLIGLFSALSVLSPHMSVFFS